MTKSEHQNPGKGFRYSLFLYMCVFKRIGRQIKYLVITAVFLCKQGFRRLHRERVRLRSWMRQMQGIQPVP